jgi:hypothetical protein
MLEKDFEDIICKYPELIEEGLKLIGRQLSLYGRRMDVLFEDKFKRKLIIELKAGPIKDEHVGQILSYEGMLLSEDDPTVRVMLVGTRVPPNMQRSLDHHGIAWGEITISLLKEFLKTKGDEIFLNLFEEEKHLIGNKIMKQVKIVHDQNYIPNPANNSNNVENLSELHKNRFAFFEQFLFKCNQKTNLFSNISPNGYQHWISAGAGTSGLQWGIGYYSKKPALVEIYFCSDSSESNRNRIEYLASKKLEIEKNFGEILIWDYKKNRKQQHIISNYPIVNLNNESNWSIIQNDLVERLIRLEKTLRPYIKDF